MQPKDEGRKLISRSGAAENEMNYEQKREGFFFPLYLLSKQRETGTEESVIGGSGLGFFPKYR